MDNVTQSQNPEDGGRISNDPQQNTDQPVNTEETSPQPTLPQKAGGVNHKIIYALLGVVIVVLLGVIGVLVMLFQNKPVQTPLFTPPPPDNPTPPPTESPLPTTDPTAGWETYTTNEFMDLDPLMYEEFSEIKQRELTFRYPGSWTINPLREVLVNSRYGSTAFLGFDLRKDDPRYSPCNSEGPCENFANIILKYGVVTEETEDFDPNTWGRSFPLETKRTALINGVTTSQAFLTANSPFPINVIFKLSPTEQLNVYSEIFEYGNDPFYQTPYNTQTVNEINQILSTFQFTDSGDGMMEEK